jgi:hypothetical protein
LKSAAKAADGRDCTPENAKPEKYGGKPCCDNPVTKQPFIVDPNSGVCTKCFYVKEFSVKNNCEEAVVVQDFGTVPAKTTKIMEPTDSTGNGGDRIAYSFESRSKGYQNDGIEVAGSFYRKFLRDGKTLNPNPEIMCGAPDFATWYGWSIPVSLIAYKHGADKSLEPNNLACIDPGAALSGNTNEADCHASGGGWMCKPGATCKTPDGHEFKANVPMDCSWPDYESCEQGKKPECSQGPKPASCTSCPGSVGECEGKPATWLRSHTLALNGKDASWTQLYTKEASSAGPPSLVGYWTTPEQQCFKDDPHHGSLGWMFDCKQKAVELDWQLTLCPADLPSPTPFPIPR